MLDLYQKQKRNIMKTYKLHKHLPEMTESQWCDNLNGYYQRILKMKLTGETYGLKEVTDLYNLIIKTFNHKTI